MVVHVRRALLTLGGTKAARKKRVGTSHRDAIVSGFFFEGAVLGPPPPSN
jgi:hypothetical protein